MGRSLIIIGLLVAAVGLLISLLQLNSIPRLPGDITVKRENFTFYFPLGWCVLISVLLGVVNWFLGR